MLLLHFIALLSSIKYFVQNNHLYQNNLGIWFTSLLVVLDSTFDLNL